MYDDLKNAQDYDSEQDYNSDSSHSYYENQSPFNSYLLPNEHIIWEDKYHKGGGAVSIANLYTFIFSIFWLGFAVFWTIGATLAGGLFGLFGIPFILIGLVLLKSRFSSKKCQYAITDMRVMSFDGKKFNADMLNNVVNISVSQGSNNIGNVTFSIAGSTVYNNRNNVNMMNTSNGLNGFYGVQNPNQVFNILNTAVYSYIQYQQ